MLSSRHPDKRLLFHTGSAVSHGHGVLVSMRAGFQEATGITFRGGNSPSSGFVAAQIASQMCSSVTLYGFSLRNCVAGCPRYHYWTKTDGPERGTQAAYWGHQYEVEGWLLQVRSGSPMGVLHPGKSHSVSAAAPSP